MLDYGEAPKPLELDIGPSGEIEEKVDKPSTDDTSESSDAKPREQFVPPKTDEYLWQWKASPRFTLI